MYTEEKSHDIRTIIYCSVVPVVLYRAEIKWDLIVTSADHQMSMIMMDILNNFGILIILSLIKMTLFNNHTQLNDIININFIV